MTPNPSSILADFYDIQAKTDNYIDYYKTVPFYSKGKEFLARAIRDGVWTRVLDVACGSGHLASDLPETVDLVGIDISPEMIGKARALCPIGRYFVHDFHIPLPESEERFDIVFASGAFDLCNDIVGALSALNRSLKDDGLFYFTVLERRENTPYNRDREINARPDHPDPIRLHFFSFQEVSEALAQIGLVPLSYRYAAGWKSRILRANFDYGYWIATRPEGLSD
uniref:Methyltransferase domain-containing protein n=1 Tax=Candidatus Kentrum sp. SD TaxID=2126332 RepID=A0A451BNJ7_9GAMM|nr:MAG: Methyltransferase domain-containing protein [Candidatus Kentron sp. SD]VFK48218.1 MAG: Methyltransferase domain-containing protein [Candidatus Kentron sp. SD]VFK79817.1 MAG: Methyltransferase domain-containing protein [Candidatus Kentron sp. SD]